MDKPEQQQSETNNNNNNNHNHSHNDQEDNGTAMMVSPTSSSPPFQIPVPTTTPPPPPPTTTTTTTLPETEGKAAASAVESNNIKQSSLHQQQADNSGNATMTEPASPTLVGYSSPHNAVVFYLNHLQLSSRQRFQLLTQSYFYQLKEGCKNPHCTNPYCFSNPSRSQQQQQQRTSPEDIARISLQLAKLSFVHVPLTTPYFFCETNEGYVPPGSQDVSQFNWLVSEELLNHEQYAPPLSVPLLAAIVRQATAATDSSSDAKHLEYKAKTIQLLSRSFGSLEALSHSFLKKGAMASSAILDSQSSGIDLDDLSLGYNIILDFNKIVGEDDMVLNAISLSIADLVKKIENQTKLIHSPEQLRPFLILLLNPIFLEPVHHQTLASLSRAVLALSATSRLQLILWCSILPPEQMQRLVGMYQHFITIQLYVLSYIEEKMEGATQMLSLLNQANESGDGIIPYTEFYNDAVNNVVDLREDFLRWIRAKKERLTGFAAFAFCNFPFILDLGSKSRILQLDARYQQETEQSQAFVRTFVLNMQTNFNCVLRVHRDNIVYTALNELAAREAAHDLKKPLRVMFYQEEGVDEGGVKKEFFQLIVRQIFDVAYGMFTYNEESRTFWFNPHSFENNSEFHLIGLILGLAIYNSVILDVHFPMVVYKKLLSGTPTLDDLKEADPSLGRGLQQLLDFEGDVETVYCRSFQLETEVFGQLTTVDLMENGGNIPVTNENRAQYVDLYVRYILTISVERQFKAFMDGFMAVLGESILKLFRPEEIERLICGSPDLDFEALERNTRYDDGFNENSRVIRDFWRVVHSFTLEEKKKLLAFCTGSDRVPVKGLGNLLFIISKNGPDSDRLPTAHTCFNHLLLPEYSSEEKLRERLLIAINNAEGFGLR